MTAVQLPKLDPIDDVHDYIQQAMLEIQVLRVCVMEYIAKYIGKDANGVVIKADRDYVLFLIKLILKPLMELGQIISNLNTN
jgi:hypothetical protein